MSFAKLPASLLAGSDTSPALERISKMAEWDRQQRARVEERSKLGLGKKGSSKSISFTERELFVCLMDSGPAFLFACVGFCKKRRASARGISFAEREL